MGTSRNRGAANPRARLTVDQVGEIRDELAAGVGQSELARRHGVARQTISNIGHGRTWRSP